MQGDPRIIDMLNQVLRKELTGINPADANRMFIHLNSDQWNAEDTNDLLQDVFAKAYRSIKGFQRKSSFYTWMHSIAVNMTINFLKKRGRRQSASLDDEEAGVQFDRDFLEATEGSDPRRGVARGHQRGQRL